MNARDQINKLLEPFKRSLQQVVTRGIVKLIDTNQLLQMVQVELLTGGTIDKVEYAEPYGYTSAVIGGDKREAIALSVNGSKKHSVVISCFNREYRLQGLADGEVALYTDEGDSIILKRGGIIEHTASTKILLNAPLVEVAQDLLVKGDVLGEGDVFDGNGALSRLRNNFNVHGHIPTASSPPTPQDV